VREESAKALGRHRVRAAQPALRARLNDAVEERYVRAEAARALGQLGARDTASDLRAAARPDAAPELKLAVLEALCALDPGGPDTQAALQSLADDEDVLVAAAARHRRGAGCGS
jgi:HEAT repeat protein